MNEKLQNLLNTAPLYKPPVPEGVEAMVLESEDIDEVTTIYIQQSSVEYKYNSFDGLSIFSDGKYQLVSDVKEVRLHIRKFLARCRILKKKAGLVPLSRKTNGFISDMIETLCSLPDVHLLPSQKAPCSLDGSHDPQKIIAASNCLISIKEYPFMTYPITDQFYTHNYLDYDYLSDARSEKWDKFITDITIGDLDLALLLQQWCGYLLMPTLKYQKFLLCIGDGANGKGVFFDTIAAALGKNNVSNVSLVRFADKHTLFGTYGELANMSNENTQDLESAAEGVIKEYVAGDKVLWEQKYKDPFFAYPTAKLMFACNELPRIRDDSDGMWRRMILVPIKAKFMGEDCDINLAKKLQEPKELAGVLNWMLRGAVSLMVNEEFVRCDVAVKELNEYRDNSNTVRLFLNDNVELAECSDETRIPCTPLHKWYSDYCEQNGFKPKNNVNFGHSVFGLFGRPDGVKMGAYDDIQGVQKSRVWVNDRKVNVYIGIKPQAGSVVAAELSAWWTQSNSH